MKLCRSSLGTANSLVSNVISTEQDNINNLIEAINSFTVDSKEIYKGDAWDLFRGNFATHIESLKKSASRANELASACSDANSVMSNFLDSVGCDSIDDSNYDELVWEREKANVHYSNLQNNKTDDGYINSTGMTLAELDEWISKYDKFRSADAVAFGKLSALDSSGISDPI